MNSQQTALTGASIVIAFLGAVSCGGESTTVEQTARVITQGPARPLGWLGGRVRASADIFTFQVDGKRQDTGGLVLESATPSGPLAAAGVIPGDVIVGVADEWVPIKDDPWLDLVGLVETRISSGATSLALHLQRDGQLTELELPLAVKTLEEGLPLEVVRFDEGALRAVQALAPAAGADVGALAWTGLARLAAGAEPDEVSLATLSGGAATPDDDTLGTGDLVAAIMLETERLGPLPPEVAMPLTLQNLPLGEALGNSIQFGQMGEGMPGGMYSTGTVTFSGEGGAPPVDLSELLASGGGNVQVMSIGGDAGGEEIDPEQLREMLNLPEGAQISVMSGSSEDAAAMFGGELPEGAISFETLDLETLLEEHAPERLEAMAELQPWLDRLVAAQEDDGSWTDEGADPFRTTCEALCALGMAQRAGLEVPAETVEKGVASLRPALHHGEIAAHVARGGNRRDAMQKTLLAVRALQQLGCSESDELFVLLDRFLKRSLPTDFSDPRDLLARALQLRGGGVGDWQRFYDEHRLRLVAAQDPNGSFDFSGAESDTAIGAVLLSLQHARTPLLIGTATNPIAPSIDGHGRRPEAAKAAEEAEDSAEGEEPPGEETE